MVCSYQPSSCRDWPQRLWVLGKAVPDARTGLHWDSKGALQSPIHPTQGTGLSCCVLPALGTLSMAGWLWGLSSALRGRDAAESQLLHPAIPAPRSSCSSCIPQLLHPTIPAPRNSCSPQLLHPTAPADPTHSREGMLISSQQRRDAAGGAEGWLLSLAGLQDGSGCGMGTAQAGPMGTEDGWQPETARLREVLLWK